MPTVSFIVPVYNSEAYLPQCVDSILNQTFKDFELILVNDGSSDHSGIICDEFAQQNSNIKVIHQQNKGQAASRNRAVDISRGEWIVFVDSDDIIHPQMLECLYTTAIGQCVPLVMCSPIESSTIPPKFFLPVSPTSRHIEVNETSLLYLVENDEYFYWIPCCKLIKKTILQSFPFPSGRIYEDNAIVFRWLISASQISIVDASLYFYRINPSGTTNHPFSIKSLDCLWALEENINYYCKNGYPSVRTWMCNRFFSIARAFHASSLKYLADTHAPQMVASQMRRIFRKNRKHCSFSTSERIQLYEIMYPNRMYLYWQFKGILHKIQRLFK